MSILTVFGLIAVTLMLLFYALENRSRWYTLGFAAACVLGSVSRALGHSDSWRPYGRLLQSGAGGWLRNLRFERVRHFPLVEPSIE